MIIRNTFHGTETEIRPINNRISSRAYHSMIKRLCPHNHAACQCQPDRLFVPVDSNGYLDTGNSPEFYEIH